MVIKSLLVFALIVSCRAADAQVQPKCAFEILPGGGRGPCKKPGTPDTGAQGAGSNPQLNGIQNGINQMSNQLSNAITNTLNPDADPAVQARRRELVKDSMRRAKERDQREAERKRHQAPRDDKIIPMHEQYIDTLNIDRVQGGHNRDSVPDGAPVDTSVVDLRPDRRANQPPQPSPKADAAGGKKPTCASCELTRDRSYESCDNLATNSEKLVCVNNANAVHLECKSNCSN